MVAASYPLHYLRMASAPKPGARTMAVSLSAHAALAAILLWVLHTPATPEFSTVNVDIVSLAAPAPAPARRREENLPPLPKVMVAPASGQAIPLPKPERQQAAASVTTSAGAQGRDVSTVIHEASYRRQIPPRYPAHAFELGQEGTVELHVLIEPDGHPRELKIEHSSGYPLLDDAALAAVRQWEFEVSGAEQWVRVPVQFKIQ